MNISMEITHQRCPFVDCGSSNAFSYNSDVGTGYCFSCSGSWPAARNKEVFDWAAKEYPRPDELRSPKLAVVSTPEPVQDGVFSDHRGISIRTMEKFGVKTSKDKTQQYYVYPSGGIKTRNLVEKGFFTSRGFPTDVFFGQDKFTAGCANTITITEGELDAMSVYQMLQDKNPNYMTPVVSLPSATPSSKLWENTKDYLSSFKKIVLSVDNDEAGNAVASKIAKLYPNKVFRVPHDKFKDANDFLTNHAAKEFTEAWFNAKKYTPENVLNTPEQFLKVYHDTPEYQYVETGIHELDAKIMGLMQGHFTVIKAQTGIGKTEIMRFLEYRLIKAGIPIATWHLEETKLRSILGLVSYEANDNLTRRDLIDAKGAHGIVEDSIKALTKDGNWYQFFLEDGQGADDLCDQIRFFSQACECKFVFFEPIQDVVSGSTEESKEQQLADLSVRLSKMAADLNVGIVTIAHTNEYGDPKYCKMIGQRASVILDLQRDKEAITVDDRNTTYLKVEKNRPCSQEGPAGKMRFNYDTFTLREVL